MKNEGNEKIVSKEVASALVSDYKKTGKTVGCLSGSFDLMTAVHFKALYERSLKCDVLIVLLNSDSSIQSYKGISRPVVCQSERSYTLSQSPHVSHIVIFDELTPVTVLDEIKPDIFFNVSEWGQECVERSVVEKNGGTVMLFDFAIPSIWSQSSSELISQILKKSALTSNKAIFLDRDGVINKNKSGYTYQFTDFEFLPGVIEALKMISDSEYKLFIVTNQSGIGRDMYTESDVDTLHSQMIEHLATKQIIVDGVYYCPHHPDDGCECRKPKSGMFLKAAAENQVNLSKSWFVGDSESDVIAGRNINIKTVYVGKSLNADSAQPNYSADNLLDAVKIML